MLVVLRIIASIKIGVNHQFYSWGAIKKGHVLSAPKKLKDLFYQVIKAVVFKGKSTPPLSNIWYAVHGFRLVATIDLC